MRPGELFALTWDDINFDEMTISVTKTLLYQKLDGDEQKTFHVGDPKTKQSTRKVPINRLCEIALKKQFMQKAIIERKGVRAVEFSDRLFVTKFNTPLNSVLYSAAIQRIVEEINLMRDSLEQIKPFAGHTFRHTFATRCIGSDVQPKTLQKYLGHANLQMTMDLYVHVTDNFKQQEMEKLENALDKIVVTEDSVETAYQNASKPKTKIIDLYAAVV